MKKKTVIESKTYWYIEPIGSHTNQVIARRLAELTEVSAGTNQSMKDNNNQEHSVFEVPSYSFITELYKSAADLELKFNVYTRAFNHGPIRLWLFGNNKTKKDKELNKVNQKLKTLIKKKKGVDYEGKT